MPKRLKHDIHAALRDGAVVFSENQGRPTAHFTEESDQVMAVYSISDLAETIIRTKENLFSMRTDKYRNQKYVAPTKLGQLLLNALQTNVPNIRNSFAHHAFNPHFELFVQHARNRGLDYGLCIRHAQTAEEVTRAKDILQGLVDTLREEGARATFKEKLRHFHRGPNKNCQSLNRYLKDVLAQYSTINLRRYDLSYKRDESLFVVHPCVTDASVAKKQREAFLKELKKSAYAANLIGYAWKMENSAAKGYLHHVLLVLDERSLAHQAEIDDALRKIWDKATEETGLLVNCGALLPSRKSLGVGRLDKENRDAWVIMRGICIDMTQTDSYLKLDVAEGRAFGRSEVTEKKDVSSLKKSIDHDNTEKQKDQESFTSRN